MSETERITNEVMERHMQIPSDNLLYHLEHDGCESCAHFDVPTNERCPQCGKLVLRNSMGREINPHVHVTDMNGNWAVQRTDGGVEYVHATVLRPGPNVSHKRWPAWLREGLSWGFAISIFGIPVCWWGYHASIAFRALIDSFLLTRIRILG